MKLTIILPSRNEEKILNKTVNSITTFLKGKKFDYELLVVLNGSTDNSKEILKELIKNNSSIKVLHSKPGYGHALKKGLKNAKGNYVIVFNVDFFDLQFINMVDVDILGKDLIIGSKRSCWATDERPLSRKMVSLFFNLFLKVVYGFQGSDTHGIKIIKKKVVDTVLSKCKTTSGIFDTEFVLRSQKMGFKIADFPVDVKEIRPTRFANRLMQTPIDIYNLYQAMEK